MTEAVILTIHGGNSIDLTVVWTSKAGEAEVPSAVRYQVFDAKDNRPVSEIVPVDDLESGLESNMTFTVPGSNLPANNLPKRKLLIKVEGTFTSENDTHAVPFELYVRRIPAFAP
jgi:hypothetical protein